MKVYTLLIGILVLLVHSGRTLHHSNFFDAIQGCLQFDIVPGYDDVQMYFPVSQFRNVRHTATSRVLRIGIVGKNDGHIRYGNMPIPYNTTVIEIVIGGKANTVSMGRLQTRWQNNKYENDLLVEVATPNILSASRPMVFRLEVFNNGLVQMTSDGEFRPFFEFKNPMNTLTVDYIAFTKWDVDMIYFFDCPL